LKNLTVLDLTWCKNSYSSWTNLGFKVTDTGLSQLTTLTCLALPNSSNYSWRGICGLTKLKALSLHSPRCLQRQLGIINLTNLERLILKNDPGNVNEEIRGLTNLTDLALVGYTNNIDDYGLWNLTKLTRLILANCRDAPYNISDDCLARLTELESNIISIPYHANTMISAQNLVDNNWTSMLRSYSMSLL
jgi:hypothetical protein